MTAKITITFEDGTTRLVTIRGYCKRRQDFARLLEHMMASDAARHAAVGNPAPDVTITLTDGAAGARTIPHAGRGAETAPAVDALSPAQKRANTIARRNRTYVEAAPHMVTSPVYKQHEDLRQYINAMPNEVQGLDHLKGELHRWWWDWYDGKLTSASVGSLIEPRKLSVRLWLGEWLMMRFEVLDFTGRQERLKIQQWVAGLKAGRMSMQAYDAHVSTSMLRLHRQITSEQQLKVK